MCETQKNFIYEFKKFLEEVNKSIANDLHVWYSDIDINYSLNSDTMMWGIPFYKFVTYIDNDMITDSVIKDILNNALCDHKVYIGYRGGFLNVIKFEHNFKVKKK